MRIKVSSGDGAILVLPFIPFLSGNLVFKYVAYAFMMFLVIKCALIVFSAENKSKITVSSSVGLFSMLVLGLIYTDNFLLSSVNQVVQFMLIILIIMGSPAFCFSDKALRFSIFICLLLLCFFAIDDYMGTKFFFENKNTYALHALCLMFLVAGSYSLSEARYRKFNGIMFATSVLVFIYLCYKFDSRAVILSAVYFAIMYGFNGRASRLMAYMSLIIPIVIIAILVTSSFDFIKEFIPNVGDKTKFSGRDIIWTDIVSHLAANNWHGEGLGSKPGGLFFEEKAGVSAHNGFIQIMYQFGLLGVILFFSSCFMFIRNINLRQANGVAFGVIVFSSALIHELFEVKMTQNHFGSGLFVWALSSMALNRRIKLHGSDFKVENI